MTQGQPYERIYDAKNHAVVVLAIDPMVRGFGYTVFRGPHEPLDWGCTDIRFNKNYRSLKYIRRLIKTYQPEIIVTEDCQAKESRRCERIRRLVEKLQLMAASSDQEMIIYSPEQVREVFSNFDAINKHQIAIKIVQWLPEFRNSLPQKRKIFEPEHARYSIFDAAAFAITYFYLES